MNHDVAEVNGSDPPMLPGSFLYEKEPGYEANLAARMLNQLRRGHRAWPMFELKSGATMAAPAVPMLPPLM